MLDDSMLERLAASERKGEHNAKANRLQDGLLTTLTISVVIILFVLIAFIIYSL